MDDNVEGHLNHNLLQKCLPKPQLSKPQIIQTINSEGGFGVLGPNAKKLQSGDKNHNEEYLVQSFHSAVCFWSITKCSVSCCVQTCKDLMKDLIKKEYSTYFGSDGRSETSSYGAEKFMLEWKIFPFSIRSFWQICTTQN